MADEADQGSADNQFFEDQVLKAAAAAAKNIPIGVAGECVRCGEESPRLVRGVCAPCRDKYKLP